MLVIKALNFIAKKHNGQIRKTTGFPYITHPIIVMHLVSKYKKESSFLIELQVAALLHDTLEDTNATYYELEEKFGSMISSIVIELTSNENEIKKIGKNEYLKNKMLLMSKYAFLLKLIDRLSNILDNPTEKYIKDTIDLIYYLLDNRKKLTDKQIFIMDDIVKECKNKLNKNNKRV